MRGPLTLDIAELSLWERVYLAATERGCSSELCETKADRAVLARRARWVATRVEGRL